MHNKRVGILNPPNAGDRQKERQLRLYGEHLQAVSEE
jgi:hypothetical protein